MNIKTNIPIAVIYLCLSLSFLMACRKMDNNEPQIDLPTQVYDATQTRLGEKQGNPYSFKIIQKAIQLVKEKKQNQSISVHLIDPCDGGGGAPPPIVPTHTYVRFAPENVEQLSALEETGLELFDVPLNYDIIEEGDWYQDPSLPADAITYQYTLIPYGYPLPAGIPSLVLDQLFLFNENDGEELEPDDWTDGECPDPNYNPNPDYPVPPLCLYMQQVGTGDPVINATQYLIDNCLNPAEVYQTAAQLSGFEQDDNNGISLLSTCYIPAGRLKVFNTDINAAEPLRGAHVITRNFFKIDHATTIADGRWQMTKCFKKKASVKVKFASIPVTIRGINGALKVWQYVFAVHHNIGRKQKDELTNVEYTFLRDANPHSETARKWAAATTMNAYWNSRDWSEQNGLSTVPRMKIWLSSRQTKAAKTPMLSYVLSSEYGTVGAQLVGALIDELLNSVPYVGPALAALKKVIEKNLPDIALGYSNGQTGNTLNSREMYNTLLRQYGHATHYTGLLAQNSPSGHSIASDYWFGHSKYLRDHAGFGAKTDAGAQRTALIEAWGYFSGNTGNAYKYSNGVFAGTPPAINIARSEILQIENQKRNDAISISLYSVGTLSERYEGWIPVGFLHDLIDVGESNPSASLITDNVTGYSVNGVFRPMRFTNNSVQEYKQQLLNQNGNLQASEVNNILNQYGY